MSFIRQINTVEPVLYDHPQGVAKWPPNTGWPLNTGFIEYTSHNKSNIFCKIW